MDGFDKYYTNSIYIAEQCNILLERVGPIRDIQRVDVDMIGQFYIHVADAISDDMEAVFEYLISVLPEDRTMIMQLYTLHHDVILG